MLQKLNWQAYSNEDRNKTIEEIKNIISGSDGCIMNFNMFSDLAINLSIEIEEMDILELYKALSLVLMVSDFNPEKISTNSKKEWLIFLNVSFSGGKGELKKEIPAVP